MLSNNSVLKIIEYLIRIPGVLFIFAFRGYFQALVATKLGDPTPRQTGRLTLNPQAHIDLIGFIFMVLFRFGWTKPVEIRTRYFKKIKRDCAIYYLSGPFAGILAGFIMSFFFMLTSFLPNNNIKFIIALMFSAASSLGVVLGLFYLLPLPGFDGYNFIVNFLPYKYYRHLYNLEKYSTYIFMIFILLLWSTNLGEILIGIPAGKIIGLFEAFWNIFF